VTRARDLGRVQFAGVEGTSGYGTGLTIAGEVNPILWTPTPPLVSPSPATGSQCPGKAVSTHRGLLTACRKT